MPSQDTASACKGLVEKTLPFLYRPPHATREVKFGEKTRLCSSEIWGVALDARKQQPGEQEVDLANQELAGFLMELAGKGLAEGDGAMEMTDVCDGVIYSFCKL